MGAIDRVFRGRRGSQERPLAAQVAALFANGEQGLWYDVEGFRDSWSSVGPELLPEGSFDSATGWNSIEPGWTVSGGRASVNNTSGTTARLQRGLVPPVDRWYVITVEVASVSSGSLFVTHGGTTGPTLTKPGRYSFLNYRTANYSLYIAATVGTVAELESISVKEWSGLPTCTLYQDSSGTTPAYAPGQGQVDSPIGLVLDRRLGLVRGANRFNDAAVLLSGESTRISPGVYRCYSSAGAYNLVNFGGALTIGKWYELTFTVDSVAVAGTGLSLEGGDATQTTFSTTTAGVKRCIFRAAASYIGIKRNSSPIDFQVSGVSICELSGNHVWQASTPSRPTLSARYNQFTSTATFNDAAWNLGTYWSATVGDTAPDGSPSAVKITSLTGGAATTRTFAATSTQLLLTIYMKAGVTTPSLLIRNATTATPLVTAVVSVGTITSAYGNSVTTDAGDGWRKVVMRVTSGLTIGDNVGFYFGATGSIPPGQYWYLWHPDLRALGDGVGLPEYQYVLDATTYDAAGFPLHLKFDGVDDFMQTGNVDFTGLYSVAVFASCRKLNDAAQGMLVEASTAYTTGPDGRFALLAPAVGDTYGARYAAGADVANLNALAVASPNSSVLSMIVDANNATPANRLSFRRNGSGSGMQTNSTLAAPAAMGNWPIYIGRRAGASLPFNGRLYGLLIRAGAINDGQIQKVERFLNQKAKVF